MLKKFKFKIINKNKKIFFIILFIILISLFVYIFRAKIFKKGPVSIPPAVSENKVELKLEPEYSEYFINQDVWIKVSVVNNSIEDYYLKFPLNRTYTYFMGTDPSGKKVTDSISVNSLEPEDSLRLVPGSSYEKVIPLNKSNKVFFTEDLKDTGVYKIKAGYQNLVSDEINLKVNLPAGDDKELYNETYGKLLVQKIPDEERIYKLEELLKKYPASKYSPQLYSVFFRESNYTNDYNRQTENISDFFKYNNDTYGAELILEIGNHNLEKLSSKYRDTKTGYLIRQRRKEALTHK